MKEESLEENKKVDRNPFISVVICTNSTKRYDMTVNCVYSIFNNTYKNYEIILVIDGNEELRQKIKVKFGGTENILIVGNDIDEGPSIGRNTGIKFAKGDIVAFIDDDALAREDWMEMIVKNFSNYPDIVTIGGKLLPVYEDGSKKLPEELLWIVGCIYKGHPENKQLVRNVISANMAVKKDIFKDVKFEVMHNTNKRFIPIKQLEDTLFCARLNNKKNGKVLYDPDMVVYHNVPMDRLKFSYIIKRSFSEGILKARLKNNVDMNGILSYEQNYLKMLLSSIIKNFYSFKIRNSLLLSVTIVSVAIGYVIEMTQKKIYQ